MKTLSPQLTRTLALVVLLVLAGGAASLWISQHRSAAPPAPVATTPAVAKPAPHRVTPAATTPALPVAKPAVARPAPAVHRSNLVDSRLPAPLQWALSQHRVVVVSFYEPQADVDAISVAEAHQGALDAKAGFLLVNVLDNAVAGPLTALLPGGGLLPDPGVLVYRAPGKVVYRFDGFADRDTIAQAAADAKAGQTAADVTDPGLSAGATTTPTTP